MNLVDMLIKHVVGTSAKSVQELGIMTGHNHGLAHDEGIAEGILLAGIPQQ